MKIWTKVHIKDVDKNVNAIAKSFTNYLYGYGPIRDLYRKYNVSQHDRHIIDQDIANRIAGLLMLYFSKDYKRINDIANKYNVNASIIGSIIPEIEGYIEK